MSCSDLRPSRRLRLAALIAATATVVASSAVAATLPLTGALRSAAGGPVADGEYILFASLYDAVDAPAAQWSAVVKNVNVTSGSFHAVLGLPATIELGDALFLAGKPMWIGIAVGNDPELPRLQLGPVPFAMHAQVAADGSFPWAAAEAPGGAATALACSGCVTASMVAAGSIRGINR